MKKTLGYTAAFIAGTLFSGGVALAATTYVQAQKGTSVIDLNGSKISAPPKLIYGGTTYVQLYSIQQALQQVLGTKPSWDGNTFNILTSTGTSSTTSPNTVIGVSQLPYTFTATDGMKLTINSITQDESGTEISMNIGNIGTKTNNDVNYMLSQESNIAANGKGIPYVTDWSDPQNINFTQQIQNTALNLNPGESLDDTVTYGALPSGTTQFTLYFANFDYHTYSLTFDLAK